VCRVTPAEGRWSRLGFVAVSLLCRFLVALVLCCLALLGALPLLLWSAGACPASFFVLAAFALGFASCLALLCLSLAASCLLGRLRARLCSSACGRLLFCFWSCLAVLPFAALSLLSLAVVAFACPPAGLPACCCLPAASLSLLVLGDLGRSLNCRQTRTGLKLSTDLGRSLNCRQTRTGL